MSSVAKTNHPLYSKCLAKTNCMANIDIPITWDHGIQVSDPAITRPKTQQVAHAQAKSNCFMLASLNIQSNFNVLPTRCATLSAGRQAERYY